MNVILISKFLQILSLQPRISKVFLDHQNNFFLHQVRTILVTKYHLQAVVCVGVLLAFFYNVVVSWALWYLVVSLMSILVPGSRLEWAYCDHPYNNHTTCNHTTTSVEEYWSRNVLAHSDHDWTNYVSSISLYLFKFRCSKLLECRSQVNQGQNSDMGEGGIKNGQKITTSFMDGPQEEVNECI